MAVSVPVQATRRGVRIKGEDVERALGRHHSPGPVRATLRFCRGWGGSSVCDRVGASKSPHRTTRHTVGAA